MTSARASSAGTTTRARAKPRPRLLQHDAAGGVHVHTDGLALLEDLVAWTAGRQQPTVPLEYVLERVAEERALADARRPRVHRTRAGRGVELQVGAADRDGGR